MPASDPYATAAPSAFHPGWYDVDLLRQHLASGERQSRLLLRNSDRRGFDIHPDGWTLVVAVPLLSDSDLVRVEW